MSNSVDPYKMAHQFGPTLFAQVLVLVWQAERNKRVSIYLKATGCTCTVSAVSYKEGNFLFSFTAKVNLSEK